MAVDTDTTPHVCNLDHTSMSYRASAQRIHSSSPSHPTISPSLYISIPVHINTNTFLIFIFLSFPFFLLESCLLYQFIFCSNSLQIFLFLMCKVEYLFGWKEFIPTYIQPAATCKLHQRPKHELHRPSYDHHAKNPDQTQDPGS